MQGNKAVEIKCECGAAAVKAVAFRTEPRVLCQKCYASKSMRAICSEEFLLDALEVIQREQSLKHSTLARLRRFVETFAVILLVLLALGVSPFASGALAQPSGDLQRDMCQQVGDRIRIIAMERDQGMLREDVIKAVVIGLHKSTDLSGKDLHRVAVAFVNYAYNSPAPPNEVAAHYVAGCVNQ